MPDEPVQLELAGDIYAEDKAKIAAIDWAQVHIRGDRAKPIQRASQRVRRVFMMGGGIRREKGGFKFEERP